MTCNLRHPMGLFHPVGEWPNRMFRFCSEATLKERDACSSTDREMIVTTLEHNNDQLALVVPILVRPLIKEWMTTGRCTKQLPLSADPRSRTWTTFFYTLNITVKVKARGKCTSQSISSFTYNPVHETPIYLARYTWHVGTLDRIKSLYNTFWGSSITHASVTVWLWHHIGHGQGLQLDCYVVTCVFFKTSKCIHMVYKII